MAFGLSGIPAFEYYRPASLVDALKLRESTPDAMVFLGGSDIFPRLRSGVLSITSLIDLKTIQDFPATALLPDGSLRINPQTTYNALLPWLNEDSRFSVLKGAIPQLGTPSLRNRGTLAGNICNASPSADTLAPLLVLRAEVGLTSLQGYRRLSLSEFLLGPGKTACGRHELLTEIMIPTQAKDARGVYLKIGRNKAADLAICGAAVMVQSSEETPLKPDYRIAVSGANPVPLCFSNLNESQNLDLSNPQTFERAANVVSQTVQPIDDIRASSRYRRAMVYELVLQGLHACHTHWKERHP